MICAGGGGIPTMYEQGTRSCAASRRSSTRICASELLARELDADLFVMATDADAVFVDWGKPTAKAFRRASPAAMRGYSFPAGSMGPKVDAACHFAEATGKRAAIGALKDLRGHHARRSGDDDHPVGQPHRMGSRLIERTLGIARPRHCKGER